MHTTDGGKTWQTHWIPTNFEITWVEASAAPVIQVGVGGGIHADGDIMRSQDGGETWDIDRAVRALHSVRAIDADHWVAVGTVGLEIDIGGADSDSLPELFRHQPCRALYSGDGGQTWHLSEGSDYEPEDGIYSNAYLRSLRALAVDKNQPVLSVGDEGFIQLSKDAGVHWKTIVSPTKKSLRSVAWCGSRAIAAGENGTVLLGTNAGKDWHLLRDVSTTTLNGAASVGDDVIVVGEMGTVIRIHVAKLVRQN